jgi:methyltransferase (TIGR00027 family)
MRAVDTTLSPEMRVLDDPAARHFVTRRSYRARFATRSLARATARFFDWRYPGYMGIVLLRQRYWDAALAEAVADGVDQVLLLGAGYETTAFRHRLQGIRVFEIDAPPTQAHKRQITEAAGLPPGGDVIWVGCDFEHQRLAECLLAGGFDPTRRSITVWYGVTFFITERAVRTTLADLASVSAPGSILVWDYIYPQVWDGTTDHIGARRARAAMIKRGEPYRFGTDPQGARQLAADAGYVTDEESTLPELSRRFGGTQGVWCRADDIVGIATARYAGGGPR